MKMAKLITETSYDLELVENKSDKGMHIVGIFSSANIENNNKRKYKREILEREINKVNEKIKKGSLWGELGHPPNPEINMDKIAILTKILEWKGDHVYGKAKVLDTPMGQIAKILVKEGNLGISSRGLGTVLENGYVNEDFNLITWDLVTDPSNNPSWVNGIYEGKEWSVNSSKSNEDINMIEKLKSYEENMIKKISKIMEENKCGPNLAYQQFLRERDNFINEYLK